VDVVIVGATSGSTTFRVAVADIVPFVTVITVVPYTFLVVTKPVVALTIATVVFDDENVSVSVSNAGDITSGKKKVLFLSRENVGFWNANDVIGAVVGTNVIPLELAYVCAAEPARPWIVVHAGYENEFVCKLVTLGEIYTFRSPVFSANAFAAIEVVNLGMVMLTNAGHDLNAESGIDVMYLPSVTFERLSQPCAIRAPMEVTVSAKVSVVSALQSRNASAPIEPVALTVAV